MKRQLLGIAAGIALAIGIGTGCKPKEVKVTWLETTGTITKCEQKSPADYNWTFEFSTDKGPISSAIPGPKPAVVGQKLKVKYNQADPQNYSILEDIK